MEWIKTILDRLSWFLASLIPGSVLFLLVLLHKPVLIDLVWETQLLTYSTKLFITVLFIFASGHTVNFGLTTVLRAIGGAVGGYLAAGPERAKSDVKPWQNRNWRALLTRHLGPVAPENIDPLYKEVFELRMKATQNYPDEERVQMAAALLGERAAADFNDYEWRGWWEHFHRVSFLKKGPDAMLYDHINSGFCAASFVVLFALPFTPQFRVWWIIAMSVFWILILILRTIGDFNAFLDPWSSYAVQIEQLEERIAPEDRWQHPGR